MTIEMRKQRARRHFRGLRISDPDQEDSQYDNDGARFEADVESLYNGGGDDEE